MYVPAEMLLEILHWNRSRLRLRLVSRQWSRLIVEYMLPVPLWVDFDHIKQWEKLVRRDKLGVRLRHADLSPYDPRQRMIANPDLHRGGTARISDETVSCLANLHSVVLDDCCVVTDRSIRLLSEVHSLTVSHCPLITGRSVSLLGAVHHLSIRYAPLINDPF